jgi:hypothetical protein
MLKYLLCTIFFTQASLLFGAVWFVGPTQVYQKPSEVSNLVSDGDTVNIDPGLYSGDVCNWYANRLLLRGIGTLGVYAHLKADGNYAEGKAIWVIKGTDVVVEGIEFSDCKVPDFNGAGIRAEGKKLTVRHCYFHDNEMGILTNNDPESEFLLEYNEFGWNGYGDGYSHNVYVGKVNLLIFRYNYSHHSKIGHLLKSRANTNLIYYNRLSDEAGGETSREIDLPNGGKSIILGNIIQQSSDGKNGNIVGYGLEGMTNPGPNELYVINNTFVNERAAGSFIQIPSSGLGLVRIQNNIFAGTGAVILGATPAMFIEDHNLIHPYIDSLYFEDWANFDYHLSYNSPAINAGADSTITGFLPNQEYLHPIAWINRNNADALLDCGAYEYTAAVGVTDESTNMPAQHSIRAFPNPYRGQMRLQLASNLNEQAISVVIYDVFGRTLKRIETDAWTLRNGLLLSETDMGLGLRMIEVCGIGRVWVESAY